MKKILIIFIYIFVIYLFSTTIYAQSSYVLPYPSYMPGSILYKPHLLWEEISSYWYFGTLSQFKYNLKLADKYLVEAKILFEYQQYPLAINALEKSDKYFQEATVSLKFAKQQGKNINLKQDIYNQAALKHTETLDDLESFLPSKFTWLPEKAAATILNIKPIIDNSIKIRRKSYL
ncbi:MAG: DUF5667 domain-containing protein [Candidatus Gottesmanbacteria bacterium]